MRFEDWTPDRLATVVPVDDPANYDSLREFYTGGTSSKPLDRVFEVARANGVRSVVVEYRYIDIDFRSEHSQFYSTTFQRYPSVCHRLHFFADSVNDDLGNLEDLRGAYRGYSIMRPLTIGPVGRTVLTPPPELTSGDAVVAAVRDRVSLFGIDLEVTGCPFISQDAQYFRCAHASEWMVLYHAYKAHGMPRRLPGEIHASSLGGVVMGRQLPSEGLSIPQMLNSLHSMEMSPRYLELPVTPEDSADRGATSLNATLCRYVNSQVPPIVVSTRHAWVVFAYRQDGQDVTFYRNDDSRGPYIPVDDPWGEEEPPYQDWKIAIPALPRKVYLPAERAEVLGEMWIKEQATKSNPDGEIATTIENDRLALRTYALLSNEFKRRLADRVSGELLAAYRMMQLPRYVWVVEAIDRQARSDGRAPVLGEAVIDATCHQLTDSRDPALLALHTEGLVLVSTPDREATREQTWDGYGPYESGCPTANF